MIVALSEISETRSKRTPNESMPISAWFPTLLIGQLLQGRGYGRTAVGRCNCKLYGIYKERARAS
jgi:hypothetical protein